MPEEGELFETVDSIWREIMNEKHLKAGVLSVFSKPNILDRLKSSIEKLETIHKGLGEYLEQKRLYFPRFYFMSNDELLEILSETKDPLKVEPYLKNCFEGIKKLVYNDIKEIEAMESAENEIVPFVKHVIPDEASGLVEKWLKQVEEVMRLSLRRESVKALKKYASTELKDWINKFPGQVILATSSIVWTAHVENVIY
jgi:dynein heavy chain